MVKRTNLRRHEYQGGLRSDSVRLPFDCSGVGRARRVDETGRDDLAFLASVGTAPLAH
jgi:hypothetical protein